MESTKFDERLDYSCQLKDNMRAQSEEEDVSDQGAILQSSKLVSPQLPNFQSTTLVSTTSYRRNWIATVLFSTTLIILTSSGLYLCYLIYSLIHFEILELSGEGEDQSTLAHYSFLYLMLMLSVYFCLLHVPLVYFLGRCLFQPSYSLTNTRYKKKRRALLITANLTLIGALIIQLFTDEADWTTKWWYWWMRLVATTVMQTILMNGFMIFHGSDALRVNMIGQLLLCPFIKKIQ